MMRSPGVLWIKAAVVYFIMGVGLGIYMGASGDHLYVPVHAHFNLLGWASLALVGLIYHQLIPRCRNAPVGHGAILAAQCRFDRGHAVAYWIPTRQHGA